jgi:hypothetical protein
LDWWILHEQNLGNNQKGAFKQDITYSALRDAAQAQLGMFDNDPSFECFCNID